MSDWDVQPSWGATASTPESAHACNCIGCCRKCGTCRTWHGHTAEWCALLQRRRSYRAGTDRGPRRPVRAGRGGQ